MSATSPVTHGDDRLVSLSVSPADAAAMLGVSRGTIYNLMNRGELRRVRIGRSVRLRVADLLEFLDRNEE